MPHFLYSENAKSMKKTICHESDIVYYSTYIMFVYGKTQEKKMKNNCKFNCNIKEKRNHKSMRFSIILTHFNVPRSTPRHHPHTDTLFWFHCHHFSPTSLPSPHRRSRIPSKSSKHKPNCLIKSMVQSSSLGPTHLHVHTQPSIPPPKSFFFLMHDSCVSVCECVMLSPPSPHHRSPELWSKTNCPSR